MIIRIWMAWLLFLAIVGCFLWAALAHGESALRKRCDAAHGTYFTDRSNREVCLAPDVVIK